MSAVVGELAARRERILLQVFCLRPHDGSALRESIQGAVGTGNFFDLRYISCIDVRYTSCIDLRYISCIHVRYTSFFDLRYMSCIHVRYMSCIDVRYISCIDIRWAAAHAKSKAYIVS